MALGYPLTLRQRLPYASTSSRLTIRGFRSMGTHALWVWLLISAGSWASAPSEAPPQTSERVRCGSASLVTVLVWPASGGADVLKAVKKNLSQTEGVWALKTSGAVPQQDPQIVLSPGAPQRIPDTDLTVVFEAVVEDSRCPVGTNCVWAGDATVRMRIDSANAKPTTYVLHTNDGFEREVVHGNVRIRLSSLTPEPTADRRPRAEDYRVTLAIRERK